ncbi:hypothetical protein Tco_1015938 [Tanacetum coccineum]|uniref:Uncharacterized protein n=1 Tax=Tanacetum coccineum TaxID=301880 RepID=A0ABQ5FNJ7_9ASTR
MYHKKNIDYAYLLWEDFVYQVENKNVKKSNEMYYPRFTKVIVNFFMTKDQSIPRQNSVNWHYARDDYMFTMIKVVSMHEDTQLCGAILPNELTNEDIRNSKSYKEYYVIASRARGALSVHAEEPEFEVADSDMPQDQEENLGNDDEEPKRKVASKHDWFTKPKQPQEPIDPDWNLEYDFEECYKALSEKLEWDNSEGGDYPFDLTKPLLLVMNGNHQMYDLQGIEDMVPTYGVLLKLPMINMHYGVFLIGENNNRLTNLSVDEVSDFAIALRMFTRSMRRWSSLEMKRAHIMIKAIDKQLKERRVMRSFEKFVGGRHYGTDLRLLQRTI